MASSLGDVSFWLALIFARHPHHAASVRWWSAHDASAGMVFCRVTQSAFLRISTGRAFLTALALAERTTEEAWQTYELIRRDGRVSFAQEPAGIEAVWKRLSCRNTRSPNLWTDAYLAAFAIAAGYRLVTFDRGFRQYEADGLELELLAP